ncbi:flagellar biosynthesis protein FlhF [Azotobacter salinestris]|uniref:flagellar biosynthesis protein FlhF n=1 Tax=Azotobacter salinestris TaxID=69964 RepID=UPI0032DE6075
MSVRRFVAPNSREAMRQVREALGEDALILSNRPVAEGVEILALAEEQQQAVQTAAAVPAAPARPVAPADYRQAVGVAPAGQAGAAPAPAAAALDFAALGQRLLGEMQDMRALLDRQMQAPATGGGCRSLLRQRLLGAGFGPCLSDEILAGLPGELAAGPASAPALQAWLERQLEARLPVLEDEAGLLDAGGLIALVGPTGVGKTTTAAKLAARYVMRHGASQVALISTDSFRIGAHEQLRIYARLLGVEVHTLAAVAPLEPLLAGLAGKRLIIIDTVGMSQRDRRLLTQINQLGAAGRPVRLMLLLNAACHGDTLEEVVGTYQRAALAAGTRLHDCIVSKCDEAARLGPVLDILMRHGLRLNYLSNGQQVPEDLQVAEAGPLLQQALAVSQPSPFVPEAGADGAGRRLDSWARGLFGRGRSLAAALEGLRRELDGFALLERAWRLAALPAGVQGERLARLLEACDGEPDEAGVRQLLWGSGKPVAGATWSMPLLTLDPEGRLQVRPWLAHRLPTGHEQRMDWAFERLKARRHLLLAAPEGGFLQALARLRSPWVGTVRPGNRLEFQGERHSLAQLSAVAEPHDSLQLRHRGRPLWLELRHLPVGLRAAGERGGASAPWPVEAWFGTLRDADSGQSLGQRHWLAWSPEPGRRTLAEQADGVRLLLACDDLPALTLRAWQALGEVQVPLQTELRLFLAAALAACASRLDQSAEDWAMDLRARLSGLGSGRRLRGPAQQLDALLHLLAAGDAFRQLGGERVH